MPDYGRDAPGIQKGLVYVGGPLTFVGLIWTFVTTGFNSLLGLIILLAGAFSLVSGTLMYLYSKFGKIYHRDRMLKLVTWRGNENVLDIGTGRGLLLIGAAKHLTSGKAIGIDIWDSKDLSDNSKVEAQRNIDFERVAHRTELLDDDARKLSFDNDSFDVIFSNLCIHNIGKRADRESALSEIHRVIKPGGFVFISDFKHLNEYAAFLRGRGMVTEVSGFHFFRTFMPLRIVKAIKPRT